MRYTFYYYSKWDGSLIAIFSFNPIEARQLIAEGARIVEVVE